MASMASIPRAAGLAQPLRRVPALQSLPTARTYASMTKVGRETAKLLKRGPKEPTLSTGFRDAAKAMYRDGGSPLFPATFVAVPLSKYPRTLNGFWQYQKARTTAWAGGKLTLFGNMIESMSGFRPRWRPRSRKIGTTAKAMYREVLEAFAAGDIQTIERLCVPAYALKLSAAIQKRDPRERVLFEVLKYHRPYTFPKLKSHQIRAVNEFEQHILTEQAVVGIDSTQQLMRQDIRTGSVIPGSVKIQQKVEYVVMTRNVDKRTWESAPWRIWGTTAEKPLEAWLKDMEQTEELQAKHLKFKSTPER